MSQAADAVKLVKQFLKAMEARDLVSAEAFMSPQARIVFPGGLRYRNQLEMVADAATRFRWVKKKIEQIDAVRLSNGVARVYVHGTLYGENIHGARFEGIRFIDRFEVRNERISSQEVWNDLAESVLFEEKK